MQRLAPDGRLHLPLPLIVLPHILSAPLVPDPPTTAGALRAGPPPGPGSSNVTDIGSNRWLTRENWSLQVDAPAMLRRRDHLLVFAFVLPAPATNARALPAGPPTGTDGSNHGELFAASGRTNHAARRRDYLLVLTIVLPDPATTARALPAGLPLGPDGSKETSHIPNRGRTKAHDPGEGDAPRSRRTHSRRSFSTSHRFDP
ncbi:glycosyl transferase, group 1 [Dorcoceras hygrometricum]|uniref:Glycosyl transferase, group 1 n=1 Tax=Dorcoceras hygrometricum TaxID=472368 RepID=A0A2Z7DGF5_9LAMI|nr:glycosyl transferase, group 1 [Dorcoceras hygrometricum]